MIVIGFSVTALGGFGLVGKKTVATGILVAALGGYGSYHFGKKAEAAQEQELQTNLDELLTRSQILEEKLGPFQELARTARPTSIKMPLLTVSRQDIERLRELLGSTNSLL